MRLRRYMLKPKRYLRRNKKSYRLETKPMTTLLNKPTVFEVIVPKEEYDKIIKKIDEVRLTKSFLEDCLKTSEKYNNAK